MCNVSLSIYFYMSYVYNKHLLKSLNIYIYIYMIHNFCSSSFSVISLVPVMTHRVIGAIIRNCRLQNVSHSIQTAIYWISWHRNIHIGSWVSGEIASLYILHYIGTSLSTHHYSYVITIVSPLIENFGHYLIWYLHSYCIGAFSSFG